MPAIRRRKIYATQAVNPQEYLSRFSRPAVLSSIDTDNGTCSLRWLDNPGGRVNVLLTQGSWGEYNMPVEGSVVFVQLDKNDQARIVRYLNANQPQKQRLPSEGGTGTLPKLKAGEKFWESVGGAYIYMNNAGKITLVSPFDDVFEIDPDISAIRSKTVNWKITSAAGVETFGQVRRWVQSDTQTNKVISDGISTVTFPDGTPLTEFNLAITDKYQATTPICKVIVGTVVDNNGNMVDKNDGTTNPVSVPTKQLAARIQMASGVQIDIDKEGRVSIKNAKLNVNAASVDSGDPDIALGLETNNASLGTKGQHVAREHDEVTIPLGTAYTDAAHRGLQSKGSVNIDTLVDIIKSVIATYQVVGVTAGPTNIPLTQLLPLVKPTGDSLKGEITNGAPNMTVGDQ